MPKSSPNWKLAVKLELFDLYSSNLSFLYPAFQGVFVCPLCLHEFKRDSIERELTLEHIVADALGGREYTLTCQRCNNTTGSQLEAELVHRSKTLRSILGLSNDPVAVQADVDGHKFAATLHRSPENPSSSQIRAIPKASDPESIAAAVHALEKGHRRIRVEERRGYHALRSKVAVIKLAYLLMFHHFGYGYILHENLDPVRSQINSPDQDLIASSAIGRLTKSWPQPNSITLLYRPEELRCFYVMPDLYQAVQVHLGVVMPGLDDAGGRIYERWTQYIEKNAEFEFSTHTLSPDTSIASDTRYAYLATWIWRQAGSLQPDHPSE